MPGHSTRPDPKARVEVGILPPLRTPGGILCHTRRAQASLGWEASGQPRQEAHGPREGPVQALGVSRCLGACPAPTPKFHSRRQGAPQSWAEAPGTRLEGTGGWQAQTGQERQTHSVPHFRTHEAMGVLAGC